MQSKGLGELLSDDSSAWATILSTLGASSIDSEVVEADERRSRAALVDLQISTETSLGALIGNASALLVDHRWIRLLGGGSDDIPPAHIEHFGGVAAGLDGIVVAYDVLGGVFIVHSQGLRAGVGEICYWAPDTLDWSPLGLGHFDFIQFIAAGQLATFYGDLRWRGWESDCGELIVGQGISAYHSPSRWKVVRQMVFPGDLPHWQKS